MNKWNGIGNLGDDPVFIHTPSGKPMATFTMAVDRRYTKIGENGTVQTITTADWIPVVCWGALAVITRDRLQKGSKIAVTGELQSRSVMRMGTQQSTQLEMHAESIDFIDGIRSNAEVNARLAT